MNTHNIELPPLPPGYKSYEFPDGGYDADEMQAYALAAIEADRKHFAELFMDLSRYANGMYEQEYDPQMEGLSDGYGYAAEFLLGNKDVVKKLEADRKRRGEPVAKGWKLVPETPTSKQIVHMALQIKGADVDGWFRTDGDDWPEYVDAAERAYKWALSEAPQPAESCTSLMSDKTACGSANGDYDPQPAEPVKVPSLSDLLELADAALRDDRPPNSRLVVFYPDELQGFARALLARYGATTQEQP